jgi:opacity protein-like surface antigen
MRTTPWNSGETLGLNMKKFLVAAASLAVTAMGTANAADMPAVAPIYKAPPLAIYDWTGWYAGLNAGLGMSQTSIDPFFEGSIDRGGKGFAGGAQAGLNWQFAPRWVAGFEGDIVYLGVDRALTDWRDASRSASRPTGTAHSVDVSATQMALRYFMALVVSRS